MGNTIGKYLERQDTLQRWPLFASCTEGIEQVIVIPALAEHPTLFDTLDDLAKNSQEHLDMTLVICVVNNPPAPQCSDADRANNEKTLAQLDHLVHKTGAPALRLSYIDASSGTNALPVKEGVGLARKIGLDWGLNILVENDKRTGTLINLDADTRVAKNYLTEIHNFFDQPNRWAAVVNYEHSLDGPPEERAAILCYEFFLRYHTIGLAHAQSPYAFHAIGSTIACTGSAYAAVSGMRRRAAGEDFYFLEALAKTGLVERLRSTTVYPAARRSTRTPFGTGQRIERFLAGRHTEYTLYHPACYEILRRWLAAVGGNVGGEPKVLLAIAEAIDPLLERFLVENGFTQDWEKICANAPRHTQRHDQFHRWFDGLRTLQLIHLLRDHGYPAQEMFGAITGLLEIRGTPCGESQSVGIAENLELQCALLERMRAL